MKIVFNPSPVTRELCESYPLELVDYFILNEIEGATLAGGGETDEEILQGLKKRFPRAAVVLTVGKRGVLYYDGENRFAHGIYDVPVVDTTAAGDTFCGYFVASVAQGVTADEALRRASIASSIAVSRPGAAPSIPTREEVLAFQGALV